MSQKQLVIDILEGKEKGQAVTLHGWGMYKYNLAGFISAGYDDEKRAWALNGESLANVDAAFYERFKPDTFHLGAGRPITPHDENKKVYIQILARELKKLESKKVIDEYITAVSQTDEEILASKTYNHAEILSKRYGKEVFITMNEGNPLADILDPNGLLGFEEGLIALLEKSEMTAYLLYHLYDVRLEKMKALYKCGADGYIGSETYCSADIISPSVYRDLVFPAQRHFYKELKKIGLYSICYFTGNLFPMLEDIKELGIDALLTEARNKGVDIDISQLYNQVEGTFTLYGNLPSVDILQRGTPEEVRKATLRQIRFCNRGKFIMANDCPISFGTPEKNIRAMLDTSREAYMVA